MCRASWRLLSSSVCKMKSRVARGHKLRVTAVQQELSLVPLAAVVARHESIWLRFHSRNQVLHALPYEQQWIRELRAIFARSLHDHRRRRSRRVTGTCRECIPCFFCVNRVAKEMQLLCDDRVARVPSQVSPSPNVSISATVPAEIMTRTPPPNSDGLTRSSDFSPALSRSKYTQTLFS